MAKSNQQWVSESETLEQLCDRLNAIDENTESDEYGADGHGVDHCNLPVFGGTEPRSTEGIWSWDETSLLILENTWHVVPRR